MSDPHQHPVIMGMFFIKLFLAGNTSACLEDSGKSCYKNIRGQEEFNQGDNRIPGW
jgi:hypothetical protein